MLCFSQVSWEDVENMQWLCLANNEEVHYVGACLISGGKSATRRVASSAFGSFGEAYRISFESLDDMIHNGG